MTLIQCGEEALRRFGVPEQHIPTVLDNIRLALPITTRNQEAEDPEAVIAHFLRSLSRTDEDQMNRELEELMRRN